MNNEFVVSNNNNASVMLIYIGIYLLVSIHLLFLLHIFDIVNIHSIFVAVLDRYCHLFTESSYLFEQKYKMIFCKFILMFK